MQEGVGLFMPQTHQAGGQLTGPQAVRAPFCTARSLRACTSIYLLYDQSPCSVRRHLPVGPPPWPLQLFSDGHCTSCRLVVQDEHREAASNSRGAVDERDWAPTRDDPTCKKLPTLSDHRFLVTVMAARSLWCLGHLGLEKGTGSHCTCRANLAWC